MKLVSVTLATLAAAAYGAKTCENAGEQMGPTEFTNPGGNSAICKAVKGGVRTCQVRPTCASGEKWKSLANADGSCADRACVTWPPACPSGERFQPVVFENTGGSSCYPKKGNQNKACAPTLWGSQSSREGAKCPEGQKPKSMVQADGSCGPKECTTWPPACQADEEFRPITFAPKTKNNGDFKAYCGVVKTKGKKVKGCRAIVTCGADEKIRSVYDASSGECGARQCVPKNNASTAGCGADERLGPVSCTAFNDTYCKCDKNGATGCVPKCGDTHRLKSLWDGAVCGSPVCVEK